MVCDGGQSDKARVELPVGARIQVVVGRADHASSHVAQLVRWFCPMEGIRIVVEDDGFVEAKLFRLALGHGNRFDEGHFAGHLDLGNGLIVTHSHGLDNAGAGKDAFGGKHCSVFKLDTRCVTLVDTNLGDAAAQPKLSAEFSETSNQMFQDQPNPLEGSCETFQENASEHDAKLSPVHVVFPCISVPH